MRRSENICAVGVEIRTFFIALFVVSSFGVTAIATSPHYHDYIWLEAECGKLENLSQTLFDKRASLQHYLTTPAESGRWLHYPGPKVAKYHFHLNAKTIHNCYLWARVRYDSYQHNSFWISLDQGSPVAWKYNDYALHSWHWERINIGPLNTGAHTLDLLLREEQTCVDKLLITCDATYIPNGLGKEAENLCHPNTPCPDLVITSFKSQPVKPKVGETVKIEAVIENQGEASAGPFQVRWIIEYPVTTVKDAQGEYVKHLFLAPGDKYTASLSFTAHEPGCYYVTVIADPHNEVEECDETNNRYGPVEICMTVPPPCYEVYHWFEAECGKIHNPGQKVKDSSASEHYYLTTPRNSGHYREYPGPKIAVYPFHVQYQCNKDYYLWARVRYSSYLHNSLWVALDDAKPDAWRFNDYKVNRWHWERLPLGPVHQGMHTLMLLLREEQTQVDKLMITNDPHYQPQDLGKPAENLCDHEERCPDLIVKDISYTPAIPKVGESIIAKVRVKNIGSEYAYNFIIDWAIERISAGVPVTGSAQSKALTLAPGDSYTMCVRFNCSQPDCYAMTAYVDPDNRVDECDEDNNVGGPVEFCVEDDPVCHDEYLWLEAECGSIYPAFQLQVDWNASQYQYMTTPAQSGRFLDYPGPKLAQYTFMTTDTCGNDYYLWARVCYRSYLNNSFWLKLNHQVEIQWRFDDHKLNDWHWERIKLGPLAAGPHELLFKQREEQSHLDKLLITNDASYIPESLGGPAQNCH